MREPLNPLKSKPSIELTLLQPLVYFDIFNYPITKDEIFNFLGKTDAKNGTLDNALNNLIKQGIVFNLDGFFSLQNQKELVTRRLNGNHKAQWFLKKAKKWSNFIGSFPFVRGVFISGSLSKNFMTADSDVDYFIITKPGRLWLARTLLVVFKKIFLLNSRKFFCVNYFIDENHLEIEEKNLFTAVELCTVIPTYGKNLYPQLLANNTWRLNFLPNSQPREITQVPLGKNSVLKNITEAFLNLFGNLADHFCMLITVKYWEKKFKHFNTIDFKIALKSRKYVSKHHPLNFQSKVLNAYETNLNKVVNKLNQNTKLSATPS